MPTAESVLAHGWASPSPQTLQGTTKMRIETPGRNARFRGVLIVQAPHELRAEVLSILGQPVAYLVAADQRLDLYSPYSDTLATTDTLDALLDRAGAGTLTSTDLVGLLLGGVPTCVPRDKGPLLAQGGAFAIQCMGDGDVARTLTFDAQTWLLRSVTGRSSRSGAFQVLLDNHVDADGYTLPHHVQFTAPALGVDAELSYDDIVLDEPVDPGLFVLAAPPGLDSKTFESILDRRDAELSGGEGEP